MGSAELLSLSDDMGNPLASVDSGLANLLPIEGIYSVYIKSENSLEFEDFACVKTIKVDTIAINQDTSICNTETILLDRDSQIKDFDGIYGVDFGEYNKNRVFILVADETGEEEPEDEEVYTDDKQLFFVGYCLKGNSFDLNKREILTKWDGLEQLMNEFTISGCITKNPNSSSTVSPLTLSQEKCIFNEGGFGDRTKTKVNGVYQFNKSGIALSVYWTLKDILNYVLKNFLLVNSDSTEFLALDKIGLGFNILPYINHYCKFDYESGNEVDLDLITPMDFSIEGMGLWDAIQKIVKESKSFILYKGYTSNGKVRIKIKPKSYLNRDESDQPMLIKIGEYMTEADSTILINGANINLNRETKNIGRVILNGDYLRLNTLCSSMAYSGFSGNFSSELDSNDSITFIDQSERISLNVIDQEEIENTQSFIVVPINDLETTISDLTAELNAFNNEDGETKIFDGIKSLEINRMVSSGTSEEQSKKTQDISVYIAHPFFTSDNKTKPQNSDDSDYYYIDRSDRLTQFFEVKHKGGKHGQIIVNGSKLSGKDDAEGSFVEFLDYSPISSESPFKTSKIIPILVRGNIKTDYRIKGIATIEGFDPEFNRTIVVDDESFKLSLNYKDAEFNDLGNFEAIEDGYIKYEDQDILEKIQDKAQSILNKYRVEQNSGYIELNGKQRTIKIGDWIQKFTGTNRDINTPMIVRSIVIDFNKKLTIVQLGA